MPEESVVKAITDSMTETIHVVVPQHLNGADTLFGGQLAMWIDEVAGVVAARHCRSSVTTAAIDNLRFREPVYQNELLIIRGKVTFTCTTSLEVRVDSFAENIHGKIRLINTAFVIMVSLGQDGRPMPVPGLALQNKIEQAEFAAGKRRKEVRMQLNMELYE